MGCDIHGMIEGKLNYDGKWSKTEGTWCNLGQLPFDRNYEVFAVLGNMRNPGNIPFIGECRFTDEALESYDAASPEFIAYLECWGADAHSASWVTLAEMQAYNSKQEVYSNRLVIARDEQGRITETCAGTTGRHLGEVGVTNVFGPWGDDYWKQIIAHVEAVQKLYNIEDANDIRLAFFFDN